MFKKEKKSAKIILIGCLPCINKRVLNKIFDGQCISPNDLESLDDLLPVTTPFSKINYIGSKHYRRSNENRVYRLRVGWGCSGNCTYCAIKKVFKKPRSRNINDILDELCSAFKKGYKSFLLVANELGCYGFDKNKTVIDLINAMSNLDLDFKIRLLNFSPDSFMIYFPKLKKMIKNGLISFIHLPCQSGSDKILKLMNRKYTSGDFKKCIELIKRTNPNIELKSEFIIGFPQETDHNFNETLALIQWLSRKQALIQAVPFSLRPNTPARKLAGHLTRKIIQKRLEQTFPWII